ncbi:AMP-binding protein [Weizmannia sp. CD-2023]|nr:AMP-binding protein [Weizmannia sp. CD-2023]
MFSENYTEQVKHGSRKCTKRVSWNTRYLNLVEKNLTHTLDSKGWFYTGDLGMLDEDGYLKFVGRKKEMIIRGGFNIYPQEIEAILSKHPYILESAVIGFPDEVLGEIVCAVIRLKEGADCTEEDILAYLKERIAIYKVPQRILFTQDFPTTASGKIQKVRLREQLLKTAAQNNAKSLERK